MSQAGAHAGTSWSGPILDRDPAGRSNGCHSRQGPHSCYRRGDPATNQAPGASGNSRAEPVSKRALIPLRSRAAAFTTLPIQAVRLQDQCIDQSPSLRVKTGNLKTGTTCLLPMPEILNVVLVEDERARSELPADNPWVAANESSWGEQTLTDREAGKNQGAALDKRLRILTRLAGLPHRSAHKFRHGHAAYAMLHARTPADFKAISLNMLHSSTRITDETYAFLSEGEIRERSLRLSQNTAADSTLALDAIISQSTPGSIARSKPWARSWPDEPFKVLPFPPSRRERFFKKIMMCCSTSCMPY